MKARGSRSAIERAVKAALRPNLIDRVLYYTAPQRALSRQKARVAMALAGGYTGASRGRRATQEWVTSDSDADSAILPDLPLLRERSRDLLRNNPIAGGAINTKCTNVVGSGIKLNARVDREALGLTDEDASAWEAQVEREWRLWSESPECDAERTLSFADIQELAFRSTLENGDVFVLLPFIQRPGSPYGLKLQLVEADRVTNPDFKMDSDELSGGVERDSAGAPVRYHILNKHPGNFRTVKGHEWKPVDAFQSRTGRRNVLHLYRKLRVGQTRGVPDLAPVIEPLKQLDRYTEAEVMAAVVSSMFTVFVKSETGEGMDVMEPSSETGGKSSDDDYKLSSGAILDLAPGESIETADPGRPNQQFDPFMQAVLRQVGVALELPFELLIKHFTASYSAARAALLEAWRFFYARRTWLVRQLCQPVYEAFVTEAVATGRISAPGFLTDPATRKAYLGADWIGPGQGQIDPKKENEADEIAEDRGWVTAADNTAKRGGDWQQKHGQRVKEMQMRREGGLEPGPRAPSPPQQTTEDPPEE